MPEKLTLSAYLEQRGKKAKALKRGEAEAFGIPYPLQAGWPWRYGSMEITPAMIEDAERRIQAARREARAKARAAVDFPGQGGPTQAPSSVAPNRPQRFLGFVLRQAKRYRARKSAPWA